MALAFESSKTSIRREDIAKYVLNGSAKGLDQLIRKANKKLRAVFGMHLIPLPWIPPPTSSQLGTAAIKRREFMETKEKYTDPSTKPSNYVLISTLPIRGDSILCHDQPQELFMLTTLLITIRLCPQAQIMYPELLSNMSTLDPNISDSKEHPILGLRFHSWLDKLRTQKYIARARGMQTDVPEAHDYIYTLGPRAFVEFPDDSLCQFMLALCQHLNESDTLAMRVKQYFSTPSTNFVIATESALLSNSSNSDMEDSNLMEVRK